MSRRPKAEPFGAEAMAARLRALRATTGLSQQKFAEECGLGYKQWGNFETGSRIGIDAALILVNKYRITLDWIYLGNKDMMPNGLMRRIEAIMATDEEKTGA